MRDRVIWIVPVSGLSNLLLIRRARVAKTTMELHYKATVDNKEWEVSSIEVEEQWKLKDLRTSLLSENLWDETSAVSFFRDFHPATKQLAFTTKVHQLLADNSEDNPLVVIVVLPPKDQPSSKCFA